MSSSPAASVTRRELGLAVLGSALLITLFLLPALRGGRIFSAADLLYQNQPWQAQAPAGWAGPSNPSQGDGPLQVEPWLIYAAARLHAGSLPLWNPDNMLGAPFIGIGQTALFYPLNWPFFLWPDGALLAVRAWLQLLIAALGTYLLARQVLAVGPMAAAVAVVTYTFGSFLIGWLTWSLASVAIWLPWMWWATGRLLAQPTLGRLLALAAGVALSIVAGHPETTYMVGLATGLFAVFAAVTGAWGAPGRMARLLGTWAAGYGLGAGLAAIQLLPFAEYLANSTILLWRGHPARTPAWIDLPYAWTLISPDLFGNPAHHPAALLRLVYNETNSYNGLLPLLLAPFALFVHGARHRLLVLFIAALVLLAFGTVYHWPLIFDLVTGVPLMRLMATRRLLLFVSFGLALLAAFGMEAIGSWPIQARRVAAGLAIITASLLLGGILFPWQAAQSYFAVPPDVPAAQAIWQVGLVRAVVALAAGAGLLAAVVGLTKARPAWAHGMLAVVPLLLFLDLWQARGDYNPTIAAADYFPATPATRLLQAWPGPARLIGLASILPPNTNLVYGLSDLRGYDAMEPQLYRDLIVQVDPALRRVQGGRLILLDQTQSPILDLLGVRYVLLPPGETSNSRQFALLLDGGATGVSVFENRAALPRAWLVHRVEVQPDPALRPVRLADPTFLRREVALLDHALPADAPLPSTPPPPATDLVQLTRYAPEAVELTTSSPAAGLLLLADAAFPGWVATVDGQPVPIVTADHTLRAVYLPAGVHQVRFSYQPASFTLGAAISLLALGVCGLLGVGAFRRRSWQPLRLSGTIDAAS